MTKKFTPPKNTKYISYFVYSHPYLAVISAFVFTALTYLVAGFTVLSGFLGYGQPSHPITIVFTILLFLVGLLAHPYVISRHIITILATKNDTRYSNKTRQTSGALIIYAVIALLVGLYLFV